MEPSNSEQPQPQEGAGTRVIRRRRSTHHLHRRSNVFSMRSESEMRKSENIHVLFFIIPLLIAVIGVCLLYTKSAFGETPTIVRVGRFMAVGGGVLFSLALLASVFRSAPKDSAEG